MNERLKQKCLFVSIAMHGLLVLIVVVASAFKREAKDPIVKPMTMIDASVINRLTVAAAAPVVVEPPPPTPRPTPTPPKVERPQPQPKPEPRPEPKPEPKKPDPPKPKVIKKPPTKPKTTPKPPAKTRSKPKTPPKPKPKPKPRVKPTIDTSALNNLVFQKDPAEEKRRQEQQRRAVEAAKKAAAARQREMERKIASLTTVNFRPSVAVRSSGSNTRSSIDYGSYVQNTYDRHWREPSGLSSVSTLTVTVTIRRDGSVKSARITSRSGVSRLDSSVQSLIDKVRKFKPFPSGMSMSEKTYMIDFRIRKK